MAKAPNPHCPVAGCRTSQPHLNNPLVRSTYDTPPAVYLGWVRDSLRELRKSMCDDNDKGRHLSWMSRIRLVDELYFRTLYLFFIADQSEIPHLLSGDTPNSLTHLYRRVNEEILLGLGTLNVKQNHPHFVEFSHLTWRHGSAHGSSVVLLFVNFDREPPASNNFNEYLAAYLDVYLQNISVFANAFFNGLNRDSVKALAIDLHRPKPGS